MTRSNFEITPQCATFYFKVLNSLRKLSWVPFLATYALVLSQGSIHASIKDKESDKSIGPANSWIKLETFTDHSRIVLDFNENLAKGLKVDRSGFKWNIPGLFLSDLGVSRNSTGEIPIQNDPRIAQLRISEVIDGVIIEGKWKYPKGELAPADPKMEHFDYHDQRRGRYVFDFWHKKGMTAKQASLLEEKQKLDEAVEKANVKARSKSKRRQATVQATFRRVQFGEFCSQQLTKENQILVPFFPARYVIDWKKYTPYFPDSNYQYAKIQEGESGDPKDSEEIAHRNLAIKLYQSSQPALAIRTVEFLDTLNSKSSYLPEMYLLKASALIKLGYIDKAINELETVVRVGKGSELSLQAQLFIVRYEIERGAYLQALDRFLWLQRNFKDHEMAWLFHFGEAEMLYELRQNERSEEAYAQVLKKAQDKEIQALAAYRAGDLLLLRGQYAQALEKYYSAINQYPKFQDRFPQIHLNRGEAIYWMGNYEEAMKVFDTFLEANPTHAEGWRAAFRNAEIYAASDNEKLRRKSFKAYQAVSNRFPFSAGSTLASLRLLPCGERTGLSFEAAEKFWKKASKELAEQEDDQKGPQKDLMTHASKDLLRITRARMMMAYEKLDEAVAYILPELDQILHPVVKNTLIMMGLEIYTRRVRKFLDEGNGYQALQFHLVWFPYLNSHVRLRPDISLDHLLSLSREASELGLTNISQRLSLQYQQRMNIKTGENRLRELASSGNKNDDIDLKLDQPLMEAERYFSEAKSLWISLGPDAADEVNKLISHIPPESAFSFEREVLHALIEQSKGEYLAAIKLINKAEILNPEKKAQDVYLRLLAWKSNLHRQAGNTRLAIDTLNRFIDELKSFQLKKTKDSRLIGFLDLVGIEETISVAEASARIAEILSDVGNWTDAEAALIQAMSLGNENPKIWVLYARSIRNGPKANRRELVKKFLTKATEYKGDEDQDFWKNIASEMLVADELKGQVQ